MTETKTCGCCGETKLVSDFTLSGGRAHYKIKGTTHSYCKACNAARAREWRKSNKNYKGSGRIKKVPVEDRMIMSLIRQRLVDARIRSKKFELPAVDLCEDYLFELYKKSNGTCALLGYQMVIEKGHPLCPSLDQINPAEGYRLGNVQWVCWVSNRAKGDMSSDDFYRMCELALEQRKVQRLSKAAA